MFLETIGVVDVPEEKTYRIAGLAILDNELFIASTSADVKVNDLRTLKLKRRWRAEKVTTIIDLKAAIRNKHLYQLCSCRLSRWPIETPIC